MVPIRKGKHTPNRLESPEGVRGLVLHSLDLGARRIWVVSITSRPLYRRERPGTHRTGGWVGPRAGLDMCEKSRPYWNWIPGQSSPYPVAIPTELSRPHVPIRHTENIWKSCSEQFLFPLYFIMAVLRASSWGKILADIAKTCDLCTSRLMPELRACVCVCVRVCVCVQAVYFLQAPEVRYSYIETNTPITRDQRYEMK
jgi:hypothetical protein